MSDVRIGVEYDKVPQEEKLLKIAVIGTGNCGCQMANLACEELGIDGVAINGSSKDLDLLSSPRLVKIQVGDGLGTGKDREKAKEFFMSDSGLVLDPKFNAVIENNDVIMVATSTGGGYGSGSSTDLLELLNDMYKNKIFIAVGVLPFDSEGYAAYNGTREWLQELHKIGNEPGEEEIWNVGYILYSNNRYKKLTPNKAAAKVNEAFIQDLSVLQGDCLGVTMTGGIDQRDMITVLSAHGRIVIDMMSGLEPSDIIDGSIIKTIDRHIKNESAHAELVNDKEITASALIYNMGDEFDEFKPELKDELKDTFGDHIKDTANFCDEDTIDGGQVAVVLSGLTEPAMVIDRLLNKMQKMEESITTRKNTLSKLDRSTASSNSKLSVTAKSSFATETVVNNAKSSDASKDEILKKFMERKNAGK